MRKFLTAVVLIPLGLLLLVFAVANRHWITVSFNPFDTNDPSLGITLPLFAVIILSLMVGVLVGGLASWSICSASWSRDRRSVVREASSRESAAASINRISSSSAKSSRESSNR